ncbi:MAG: hypothetical protein JWP74_3666 [Marmoricola sp.]|nr:hypothetical protein [Marmoricola sp.]
MRGGKGQWIAIAFLAIAVVRLAVYSGVLGHGR